jgi:preprotein translocase subunit SecG
MGTSISLAYLSANKSTGSVMSDLKVQEQQSPAQPAPLTVPVPAGQMAQPEAPKTQPEQTVPKQ